MGHLGLLGGPIWQPGAIYTLKCGPGRPLLLLLLPLLQPATSPPAPPAPAPAISFQSYLTPSVMVFWRPEGAISEGRGGRGVRGVTRGERHPQGPRPPWQTAAMVSTRSGKSSGGSPSATQTSSQDYDDEGYHLESGYHRSTGHGGGPFFDFLPAVAKKTMEADGRWRGELCKLFCVCCCWGGPVDHCSLTSRAAIPLLADPGPRQKLAGAGGPTIGAGNIPNPAFCKPATKCPRPCPTLPCPRPWPTLLRLSASHLAW